MYRLLRAGRQYVHFRTYSHPAARARCRASIGRHRGRNARPGTNALNLSDASKGMCMASADTSTSTGQRLPRRGFVRGVGDGLALSVAAPTLLVSVGSAAPSSREVKPGVLVVGLV